MPTFRSHAKINWHLEVLGRRADGYHELRTLFQTIDLADDLDLETGGRQVELEIEGGPRGLAGDRSNLAWRAAEAFLEAFRPGTGVRIRIVKRIPVGGGLGGGSSNAATVLGGLASIHGVPRGAPELAVLARRLGADVPFFLAGGVALGLDRGDRVVPLDDDATEGESIRLVVPDFAVSTAEVFSRWRAPVTARSPGPVLARALAGSLPRRMSDLDSWNDLEAPCFESFGSLGDVYNRLLFAGAEWVRLSGSGGTICARFDDPELEERAAAGLPRGFRFLRSRTLGRTEWRGSAGF